MSIRPVPVMTHGEMPADSNEAMMCPSAHCVNSWQRHFTYPKCGVSICTTCGYVTTEMGGRRRPSV